LRSWQGSENSRKKEEAGRESPHVFQRRHVQPYRDTEGHACDRAITGKDAVSLERTPKLIPFISPMAPRMSRLRGSRVSAHNTAEIVRDFDKSNHDILVTIPYPALSVEPLG
jgi:hypothetical protein